MENLKRINGLAEVIENLPQQLRVWYKFGNIIKFEYEKCFDYERWKDVSDIKLTVTDDEEKYKIQMILKNVSGELGFTIGNKISGLAIKDMKMDGYENNAGFRIYDFEEGELSIYCEEIKVRLLME